MAKTRLYRAVESGDVDRVKACLQGVSSPNGLTQYLLLASERGYLEMVKELLKAGAEASKQMGNCSALIIALKNNQFDIVKELLRTSGGRMAQANEAYIALLFACVDNYLETVKELLHEKNLDCNLQLLDGYNTLLVASTLGYAQIVQELLKAGADPNARNSYGENSLFLASRRGHFEVVQELLKAGADVNLQNEDGENALIRASEHGHLEIVQELLKAGADVNLQNEDGENALILASQNRHFKVVQELLKAGADVNMRNRRGISVLSSFLKCVEYFEVNESMVNMIQMFNIAGYQATAKEIMEYLSISRFGDVLLKLLLRSPAPVRSVVDVARNHSNRDLYEQLILPRLQLLTCASARYISTRSLWTILPIELLMKLKTFLISK